MFNTLLYYKIVNIKNPEKEVEMHKEICVALNIKGRILIGDYGINGNIGGTKESIELYKAYMNQHKLYKNIDFKERTSEILPFPKLRVRHRDEIITTEIKDHIDWTKRGKHVDPDTFHKWLLRGEDMVLIDMRNDYEYDIGRFKGAVRPPVSYFRDLKDVMGFYDQFKGKKIVMYCTGGIRCEPASALFVASGFERGQVYQLEGGIEKYAQKYGNEGFFEGKNFTFDDRMALRINHTDTEEIVGKCALCGVACDTYRNCINKECNKLFIGCDACVIRLVNACSEECKKIVENDDSMKRPPSGNKK